MGARFWWVNHSPLCPFEPDSRTLWFARRPAGTARAADAEANVLRLLPGDVLISATEDRVCAISVVLKSAQPLSRAARMTPGAPAGRKARTAAAHGGLAVPARIMRLAAPLYCTEHAAQLVPAMPRRNTPLRAAGTLNREALLTPMPGPLVTVLSRLLQGELEVLVDSANISLGNCLAEDAAETLIERRADLPPTHRSALLSARRGQGVFRANVEQLQQGCRITGL